MPYLLQWLVVLTAGWVVCSLVATWWADVSGADEPRPAPEDG